ncbi:MAG: hypothetical protein ABI746_05105 [Dermatophilaceae bacterium]
MWAPMANRGNATENHTGHVHAYLAGERGGAPGIVTKVPVLNKGDISMADSATIMARLDKLEASMQVMANALAGKIDSANKTLDPKNKDGLQAATQKMANAIAQRLDDFYPRMDEAAYEIHATNCRTRAIMYATCEPDEGGMWPCSWDNPGGPDEDTIGGGKKKATPETVD